MTMVAEHLPLPVGARFTAPARRSKVDLWAAPNPAELVLDPWAAPVGLAVARSRVSPWAAPSAATRITWMRAPGALLPPPAVLDAVSEPGAAVATERAIATLRAFADAPREHVQLADTDALERPVGLPLANPSVGLAAPVPFADPTPITTSEFHNEPVAAFAPPQLGTAVRDRSSIARWRLVALVSGVGAATFAVATLLTSVF